MKNISIKNKYKKIIKINSCKPKKIGFVSCACLILLFNPTFPIEDSKRCSEFAIIGKWCKFSKIFKLSITVNLNFIAK